MPTAASRAAAVKRALDEVTERRGKKPASVARARASKGPGPSKSGPATKGAPRDLPVVAGHGVPGKSVGYVTTGYATPGPKGGPGSAGARGNRSPARPRSQGDFATNRRRQTPSAAWEKQHGEALEKGYTTESYKPARNRGSGAPRYDSGVESGEKLHKNVKGKSKADRPVGYLKYGGGRNEKRTRL